MHMPLVEGKFRLRWRGADPKKSQYLQRAIFSSSFLACLSSKLGTVTLFCNKLAKRTTHPIAVTPTIERLRYEDCPRT